jgi:hypothetical protein
MEDVSTSKKSKRLWANSCILEAREPSSIFFHDTFHRYFNFLFTLTRCAHFWCNCRLFFLLCRGCLHNTTQSLWFLKVHQTDGTGSSISLQSDKGILALFPVILPRLWIFDL